MLFGGANSIRSGGADRNGRRFHGKELVVVQVAVQAAGQLGSLGPEGGTPALEKDDGHDAAVLGVGKGPEPTEAGAVLREGIERGRRRARECAAGSRGPPGR